MPWFNGSEIIVGKEKQKKRAQTLLEALLQCEVTTPSADLPFRMSVQGAKKVTGVGLVATGRVLQGSIKVSYVFFVRFC